MQLDDGDRNFLRDFFLKQIGGKIVCFSGKGESNKLISVDCSVVHWLKSFVNSCLLFFTSINWSSMLPMVSVRLLASQCCRVPAPI